MNYPPYFKLSLRRYFPALRINVVFWSLLSLIGLLGNWHWAFDLTNHFRLVYSFLFLQGLVTFSIARQPLWAGLAALALIWNIAQLGPVWTPRPKPKQAGQTVRFLQANVWASNPSPERLIAQINARQPDIVTLEECTPTMWANLHGDLRLAGYATQRYDDAGRLVLLSRYEISPGRVLQQSRPPRMTVTLNIHSQPVTLMVVHLGRPFGPDYARELTALQHDIRTASPTQPLLVIGDFNTTPWARGFQTLLHQTRLTDSEAGLGIQPTYPVQIPKTTLPFPVPFLPIDHLLTRGDIGVAQRRLGQPFGSDHLPLIVDIKLGAKRATAGRTAALHRRLR